MNGNFLLSKQCLTIDAQLKSECWNIDILISTPCIVTNRSLINTCIQLGNVPGNMNFCDVIAVNFKRRPIGLLPNSTMNMSHLVMVHYLTFGKLLWLYMFSKRKAAIPHIGDLEMLDNLLKQ